MRHRISADPLAAKNQNEVVSAATRILDERTCEYQRRDGIRLLPESRKALAVVIHCAWAWRTTGDSRFRVRVIRELDAACAMRDWNPSHFLDTAEMATAVAIGYDWLYPGLEPALRKRYEDALLDKGLRPLGAIHQNTAWWSGPKNNWSQVCGAAMLLAAEAVREMDPELRQRVIKHSMELPAGCESFYLPDGCYPEGPGYWHYGTNFHVIGLAEGEGLGDEMETPAILRNSGAFMMHVVGPGGTAFNFADDNADAEIPSPAQSWIAGHFKDPGQSAHIRIQLKDALDRGLGQNSSGNARYLPFHLLWLPAESSSEKAPPLLANFTGNQATSHR